MVQCWGKSRRWNRPWCLSRIRNRSGFACSNLPRNHQKLDKAPTLIMHVYVSLVTNLTPYSQITTVADLQIYIIVFAHF